VFDDDQSLGSLLMIQPGLTRLPDGQPYQVILLMSRTDDITGLATNEQGRVLGWPHPPYGGDSFEEEAADLRLRVQTVPDDVEAAARAWWENFSSNPVNGSCHVLKE
jgi:hypothetical protein